MFLAGKQRCSSTMQQHHPIGTGAPDYDEDFYAWTQHQAKLLRASGKTASDLPSGIDLGHLAEEIEDLGKSELRAVTSLLRQILVHLIKAASVPSSDAIGHWRTEATNFNLDLPAYYTPSMRQLIKMDVVWKAALKAARVSLEEKGDELLASLPQQCPFLLNELLSPDFSFDEALTKLTTKSSAA
jgi:hypothetical protein